MYERVEPSGGEAVARSEGSERDCGDLLHQTLELVGLGGLLSRRVKEVDSERRLLYRAVQGDRGQPKGACASEMRYLANPPNVDLPGSPSLSSHALLCDHYDRRSRLPPVTT